MRNPATAFEWLAEVDHSNDQNLPFRRLADQAKAALKAGQVAIAGQVFTRLREYIEKSYDPFLLFEGRLILALAAFQTANYNQATAWLEEAIQRMDGHQPYTAIARWMLGCVFLRNRKTYTDGLRAWQESLFDIDLLALEPGYLSYPWIATRQAQMRYALETELRSTGWQPPAGESTQPRPRPGGPKRPGWPVSQPPSPAPQQERRPPPGNLTIVASFDQIPAGDPVRMAIETEAHDSLEVDQLVINNQPYSLHAPPGASTPMEIRPDGLLILRVRGDSMNQAGIAPGDYVLLRLQPQARHRDIVAAEIIGYEYKATLKRYLVYENGRRVVLQPESENPQHKPREFVNGANAEGKYRIIGVVVAVLKQM